MVAVALRFLLSLSPAVLTIGGIVLFYEGLPAGPLRAIPLIGPIVTQLTDGRVDRARTEGAAAERVAWEDARRRALSQLEADRREAEAKIAAAELEYFNGRVADTLTIAALNEALEANDAEAPPVCAAGPAFSRRVSRALNAVGR